jgi:hypothetical protein
MPVTFADYPEHFQYSGSEADGGEDKGMELKEFEEPKPDLPAGWARQRGDRWTENPQHAAEKAKLEQEKNQSAPDNADERKMKLPVHHVSSPCTECQTTKTAVWRTSRGDATIILCNPCYIKKYQFLRKRAEQASWVGPPYESPTSAAMSLWDYSRNDLHPDTIFVIQVSRAVEAYRVAMNSPMLRPVKFLGSPKLGDNAPYLLTPSWPQIFGTPEKAMKAVTKLQCFSVLLRMKHLYWKDLRHYHIVCDESFLNQVCWALKPLRGKARVRIKAWASFTVADMGMPDALDFNFPLCFDEPC